MCTNHATVKVLHPPFLSDVAGHAQVQKDVVQAGIPVGPRPRPLDVGSGGPSFGNSSRPVAPKSSQSLTSLSVDFV